MSNVSEAVLVCLVAWTLFLLILMEALRTRLILAKAVAANELNRGRAQHGRRQHRCRWRCRCAGTGRGTRFRVVSPTGCGE